VAEVSWVVKLPVRLCHAVGRESGCAAWRRDPQTDTVGICTQFIELQRNGFVPLILVSEKFDSRCGGDEEAPIFNGTPAGVFICGTGFIKVLMLGTRMAASVM
jgi:hypothetical protein